MKMKSKTLLIILISMVLVLGMLTTTVKAAYSAKIQMVPEKTTVQPGDTIKVVVNLANIQGIEPTYNEDGQVENGINSIAGKVEYDKNFFEDIGVGEIGPDGFTLDSDEGEGLVKDGQFTVMELKISDTASGSSTVRFYDLVTTNGLDEPKSDDISLTFTVSDEEEPEDPNGTGGNGTQGGNNDDNGVRNNGINSIRGNSSNGAGSSGGTSKSKLPDAGLGKGIIIGAVVLIVITGGSYFLYKKYQKI